MNIHPARTQDDITQTKHLFKAYAATLGIDLAYQDFARELATLPGKYAPPHGEILLAPHFGCVALRPLPGADLCEMKRLYVAPAARGQGLGQALIHTIIETATRIGYTEMRLDTLPSMTAARALYTAAGFAEIAAYYETPVPGTIFLGKTLGKEAVLF